MSFGSAAAIGFGLAVALLSPSTGSAQALSCALPAVLPRPRPDAPTAQTPVRAIPIASYTLAISWAPQFCRESAGRAGTEQQCGGGNAFGFSLHGLWPDGAGKDWPQYCRPVALLAESTLRASLCATPSVQLMQHEWAKHGSCTGVGADAYFGRGRGLYQRLRYPDMTALGEQPQTAGSVAAAFARANVGMTPDMMRVTTSRDGWLDEIWLCLDRRYRNVRCPTHQGGAASTAPVRIWRSASAL